MTVSRRILKRDISLRGLPVYCKREPGHEASAKGVGLRGPIQIAQSGCVVPRGGCTSNTPTQPKRRRPIAFENRSCISRTSPLVKTSAVCSVGVYSRRISSPSTLCLKKMVSHFNVLGAIVELGVARDGGGGLIVDMEDCW